MTAIPLTMRKAGSIRISIPPISAPMLTRVPSAASRRRQALVHETERVWPNMIHHDQREYQVGNEAPGEADALVPQAHEVHRPRPGPMNASTSRDASSLAAGRCWYVKNTSTATIRINPNQTDHVSFHARTLLRFRHGLPFRSRAASAGVHQIEQRED